MAEWEKATFQIPGIDLVSDIQSGVDTVFGAVEPTMTAIATALRAIAVFQTRFDSNATLVRAALEGLLGSLDDILAPAAGHVLWVPPIAPYREPPRRPQVPFRALSDLVYGMRIIRGRLDGLEADGGNYGVYRRFIESLFDEGDYSRPQYQANAFVGGAIVVFGAGSLPTILKDLLALGDLFGGQLPGALDGFIDLPVPQNVKARPVAVPSHDVLSDFSVVSAAAVGVEPNTDFPDFLPVIGEPELPASFGVRITWDAPRMVTLKLDFGPYLFRIQGWKLYAKPGGKIAPGEDLSQYEIEQFNLPNAGTSPSAGPVTLDANIVGNINGAIVNDLDPSTSYYFAVGYMLDIVPRNDEDTVSLPVTFEMLSGQARVNLSEQAPYRKIVDGLAPDWVGISNPLRLVPAVNDVITRAKAVGDVVLANFTDYQNEANALVDQTESVLQTILDVNDSLSADLSRIENIFDGLGTGIWAATFSGQGGVPFLMESVGELLLDDATVNRPPFDNGDEPVSALVFVTGSDSAGNVSDFVSALELLLGTDTAEDFFVINDIDRVAPNVEVPMALDEAANPTTPDNAANRDDPDVPLQDLGVSDEDPC